MLKHCISLVLVLALIVSLVLVLEALCNTENATAGMAILQFNATALGLQIVGVRAPLVARRSIPTDIPNVISEVKSAAGAATVPPGVLSQAKSAASVATTALPGVVSQAESVVSQAKSAASAAATAGIGAVTAALPHNCSIGSRQFCVGSAHTVTCRDLPMNLSDILPGTVEASLQDTFGAVRDVDTALRRLTTPYVQGCFVAALVLMLVETVLFIISAYGWLLALAGLAKTVRIMIATALGLFLCVPLVATTAILFVVQSKLGQLPTWIHVEQGALPRLSLGCLLCAMFAAVGTVCAAVCI